jgi:hypothetical protein
METRWPKPSARHSRAGKPNCRLRLHKPSARIFQKSNRCSGAHSSAKANSGRSTCPRWSSRYTGSRTPRLHTPLEGNLFFDLGPRKQVGGDHSVTSVVRGQPEYKDSNSHKTETTPPDVRRPGVAACGVCGVMGVKSQNGYGEERNRVSIQLTYNFLVEVSTPCRTRRTCRITKGIFHFP